MYICVVKRGEEERNGFILIGLGLAPIYPGLLHETPTRFGKENSSKLMGYQMSVAYTGTTLLPPVFGVLTSQASIDFPRLPSLFPSFYAVQFLASESYIEKENYEGLIEIIT